MKKSWADSVGLPTGVMGERTKSGINIKEENRATEWEEYRAGIEILRDICQKNYRSKGVEAVLFGVWFGPNKVRYAVFVQDGFIRRTD
jgi:hypothetical protein